MKLSRALTVTVWVGRILLGATFIYAGLGKMRSSQDFAEAIAAYQILPIALINLAAVSLPILELSCGLIVLCGFHLRVGALGMGVMLSSFIFAGASAQLRGLTLDCGCFGTREAVAGNAMGIFLRDFILLIFAGMIYLTELRRERRTSKS